MTSLDSQRPVRTISLAFGVSLALALGAAHADVKTQERMSVSGNGLMKMANMTGTTTTTISGQRARTDSEVQFESRLISTFAGGGTTSEIVQLDTDKIYSLDNKKKTYTETSFAERRAEMQKAMENMQKSQESQQEATSGVDEEQCEWSDPKTDVKRSGEKATIAGYQAERVTITATQSCKDKKSGQVCDFGLVLDEWAAPGFEAGAETQAYYKAYAEKMGLGASASRDFSQRAQQMFGRYKEMWADVGTKMQDVKGHPVKMSFSLGVGGPQCQNAQQAQQSQGDSTQSQPSLGGALGGALGGMFGKKKEATPPPAATTPPPALPGGLTALMTVSTELISASRDPAPADAFNVPADYKKKK